MQTKRSTIPSYFGVQASNLPPVNIGEVSNKGYEIEASYKNTLGRLGINVTGNFSFAKNKILFMNEPDPNYPWQRATGSPIGMIRQHIWLEDRKSTSLNSSHSCAYSIPS